MLFMCVYLLLVVLLYIITIVIINSIIIILLSLFMCRGLGAGSTPPAKTHLGGPLGYFSSLLSLALKIAKVRESEILRILISLLWKVARGMRASTRTCCYLLRKPVLQKALS